MKLGYNTNGLAHHDPLQAIQLLAETGYQSVAITIDHQWLSPFDPRWPDQLRDLRRELASHTLSTVIETGARFLLDPRRKHWPTLAGPADVAQPRINLIRHALQIAAELESDCVSIWSGVHFDDLSMQKSLDYLASNLEIILKEADLAGVDIGFEPEPGMFIHSNTQFLRLLEWVDHPRLKMTLDVGHLLCQGELPIAGQIHRWRDRIVNVHLEDMVAGVHEHLLFGEGEIRFPPIIEAFAEIGYEGGLHVELSRHSHDAVRAVTTSYAFLQPLVAPYQKIRKESK
ncbi:MAG TPA: sugar phosphate isomerase/epimerase family protein [Pirellulaceae bacterium]|nr:sugar phosphate isomerase/epimerase family protein [Pirellulaceae bacterium]